MRCGDETASARRLPCFSGPAIEAVLSAAKSSWLPRSAAITSPPPRNGTCTIWIAAERDTASAGQMQLRCRRRTVP
jgi:hypothetical protein